MENKEVIMKFHKLNRNVRPPNTGQNCVYLQIDHWNDYSFVTMFQLSLHDENGTFHELGNIKIGFKNQDESISTHSTLPTNFQELPENYFSLGTDVDYYATLKNNFSDDFTHNFLTSLKDIVFDSDNLAIASNEKVLSTSLLRMVRMSMVKGQFKTVLDGGVPLTDFKFMYQRNQEEKFAGIELDFEVKAYSKPITNIYAIIGRNGVGKTTILNGMVDAITTKHETQGTFINKGEWEPSPIDDEYFSSLISISFSAFDPFVPPPDQPDPEFGPCYYYIGLKDSSDEEKTRLKTLKQLHKEFVDSLSQCFSDANKRKRWLTAITTLSSDENFAEMELDSLANFTEETLRKNAFNRIELMSSGHAVVLLTLTKLVATVVEKTLILVDEPESHLHPPLLSAFTRALSQLLFDRNGVAIIATHSPVVLQEIPRSCVWKVTRSRLTISKKNPDIESFGENVGVLTREVFGLEVVKSGFHTLLTDAVQKGSSYEDIVNEYGGQLGYEAKAILQSMILERDQSGQ